MEGRATSGDDCVAFRFEGTVSARQISKSVGQRGFNEKPDVLKIQKLLNLISPKDGGPAIPLKEDGFIGPLTLGAIKNFQSFHQLGSDGRVDPNGPMLKKMNEIPKTALAERNARILAKVTQAMSDLNSMATKAHKTIDQAIDFLSLPNSLTGKRAFELADLYFAFGKQPVPTTISELRFIRTTYHRIMTVLNRFFTPTPFNPFGVNIFTIDPLGLPDVAYSRTQKSDDAREIPEVHSGLIYLCEASDTLVPDHFVHVLYHELVHFVDDEDGGRKIGDKGKYRDKAMKAPHDIRMRNSDNYALLATHVHMGRARLVASQPVLNAHIPTNL